MRTTSPQPIGRFKTRLLICLLGAFCAVSNQVQAQQKGHNLIDSLTTQLSKSKQDTQKVNLLAKLAYEFQNVDPEKGIDYANQGILLAEKLQFKRGKADCLYLKGDILIDISATKESAELLMQALSIYESLADQYHRAKTLRGIGRAYADIANFPQALQYLNQALQLSKKLDNKLLLAGCYRSIGQVYYKTSKIAKAIENHFNALKLFEKLANKGEIGTCYTNIGSIYYAAGNLEKANEYYLKAYEIAQTLSDKGNIGKTMVNIGIIHQKKQNYNTAIEYYSKAIPYFIEANERDDIAKSYMNIGSVYEMQRDYKKAIEYYDKSLKQNHKLNNLDGIGRNTTSIGNSLFLMVVENKVPAGRKKEYLNLAINKIDSSAKIFKSISEAEEYASTLQTLSDVYAYNNDYKNAFEAYQEYIFIQDSIYNKTIIEEFAKKELEYTFGKREDSIKLENAKRKALADIELKSQKTKTNATLVGGFLLLLTAIISILAYRQKRKDNKLITIAKQRSEELLLNILPEEIAEELKNKGSADAKHFDEVTVLFTDFVNFTKHSERLSPTELVASLNDCFTAFDAIIERHGLEKIKTIGDAYMAVCGLPNPDPQHALKTVRASLEFRDYIVKRNEKFGAEGFEIRIGLHSGSVVAGIIGVKKFAYDIWGDTVNFAARMESSGLPGKVNISEQTYQLVKDHFTFEHRGKIEAKNKGLLDMYLVEYKSEQTA